MNSAPAATKRHKAFDTSGMIAKNEDFIVFSLLRGSWPIFRRLPGYVKSGDTPGRLRSFVPQCVDGVEPRRFQCRVVAEDHSHRGGKQG